MWSRARGGALPAYLPFFPQRSVRTVGQQKPALEPIAAKHGASPSQIALAWLLAHMEENWDSRRIALSPEEVEATGKQG